MTELQKIFALSTVNGQDNCQDLLPINGREWPRDTWLAKRLKEVRGDKGVQTKKAGGEMSNPWSISHCKNCGQPYCEECSEAHNYGNYCSPKCEREAAEEALRGAK